MADNYRFKVSLAGEDLGIFDPDDLSMNVAMQLEDKTGMSIVELGAGIARLSARSLQALVWLQRLQAGQPADLHADFKFKDLKVEDADAGPVVDPKETDSGKNGTDTLGS